MISSIVDNIAKKFCYQDTILLGIFNNFREQKYCKRFEVKVMLCKCHNYMQSVQAVKISIFGMIVNNRMKSNSMTIKEITLIIANEWAQIILLIGFNEM